jgi:uncharacterized protein (TIGR02246 family)
MPMSRRAATAALLLLTLATFKSAGAETVREAVERVNRAFIAAYTAHDSGKLALLYASDAAALPPGGDRANGREAIRRVWQGAMDAGVTNVTVRTIEVEARGDLAYEGGDMASMPQARMTSSRTAPANTSSSGNGTTAPGSSTAASGTRRRRTDFC